MLEDIVKMADCGLCRITIDKEMTISYANPYFYRLIGPYLPLDGMKEGKAGLCQLLTRVEYETVQRKTKNCIENKQEGFELEICLAGRGESIGYYEVNLSGNRIERIEGRISGILPSAKDMKFTDLVCCTAEHFIYPEDWKEYLSAFSREGLLKRFFSGERSFEIEHRRLDETGRIFWAMADLLIFKDPYSENIMCFVTVKDINASKQSLVDLEERSKKDVLTGLFNRFTTMEKIHEVFRDHPEQIHGFVMLDIDNYKKLNDTLGHVFGDRVLKEISADLKKNAGPGDIVGRLGGDEFIICLKNIQSKEELLKRLKRLCDSLHKTYPDGVSVTGSFGASMYPKDGHTFEELYPKADSALYEAKHLGRNQYAVYDGEKNYHL